MDTVHIILTVGGLVLAVAGFFKAQTKTARALDSYLEIKEIRSGGEHKEISESIEPFFQKTWLSIATLLLGCVLIIIGCSNYSL